MIDIAFDESLGILRCISSGMTSIEELAHFGRKAVPILAQARMRSGRCLVLVDAASTAVQSQDAATAFAELTAQFRPGDRTAILIGSAIAKLQSQRITDKGSTAYFSSEADARAWLLTEGGAP